MVRRGRWWFVAVAGVLVVAVVVTVVVARHRTTIVGPDVYYVAVDGSDRASGSADSPWRSVQHAVDTAPSDAVIHVGAGRFAPFSVRRTMTVVGSGARTVIAWQPGHRNTIVVEAARTTLSDFAVVGCRAEQAPGNDYERFGSSSVAVVAGAAGTELTGLTISGVSNDTAEGLNFGCFGIAVRDTHRVRIVRNDISRSGYGVFVSNDGAGTLIADNVIHDNHLMIRNTLRPGDDFGAVGVGLRAATTGVVTVRDNTLYDNWAPSHDYGFDGGAFEIFGSRHVVFTGNHGWNNQNFLETGSSPDPRFDCANLTFDHNTMTGSTGADPAPGGGAGLYLRCARNSVFADNVLTDVTSSMFTIAPRATLPGEADNLTITGNTITQHVAPAYAFSSDPAGSHLMIASNIYRLSGAFARTWLGEYLSTRARFQSVLGLSG